MTINEIYQKLGKPGCFRIRNINSLEDFAAGQRFEWGFDNGNLSFITAMCLNGKRGILQMRLDATKTGWALLSTMREIEYLKAFPPMMQWQRLAHFYVLAKMREGKTGNLALEGHF